MTCKNTKVKPIGHWIERSDGDQITTRVFIDPDDGKMFLCVEGMFIVNNYIDGIRIPFSDFSETLTCSADLEKATLEATYRKYFKRGKPVPDKRHCIDDSED